MKAGKSREVYIGACVRVQVCDIQLVKFWGFKILVNFWPRKYIFHILYCGQFVDVGWVSVENFPVAYSKIPHFPHVPHFTL